MTHRGQPSQHPHHRRRGRRSGAELAQLIAATAVMCAGAALTATDALPVLLGLLIAVLGGWWLARALH